MFPNARGRGEAEKSHREDGGMTEQPNEIVKEILDIREHLDRFRGMTLKSDELITWTELRQCYATLLLARQVQRITDVLKRWDEDGVFE